jgi:hypothetical protein
MIGKNDRFDFEQQLQNCWRVTDDIGDLSQGLMDHNLTTDQTVNALNGLQQMYEIKFNKLWDLFEDVFMQLVRDEKMASEECAALRHQLMIETQGYSGAGEYNQTRYGQLDTQGFGIAAIIQKKKGNK